jgi:hypothetical protein
LPKQSSLLPIIFAAAVVLTIVGAQLRCFGQALAASSTARVLTTESSKQLTIELSGDISGTSSGSVKFDDCSEVNGGYKLQAQTSVNGDTVELRLQVNGDALSDGSDQPYHGPATYHARGNDSGAVEGHFEDQTAQKRWDFGAGATGAVTVASASSGSFDVTMVSAPYANQPAPAPSSEHVVGSWSCGAPDNTATPALTASPTSSAVPPTASSTPFLTGTPPGTLGSPTPTASGRASSTPSASGTALPSATTSASPVASPTRETSVAVASDNGTAPGQTGSAAIVAGSGGNNARPQFARSVPDAGDLSANTSLIGSNVGLAAGTLVLIVLSAELFNKTIEENREAITGWLRPALAPIDKVVVSVVGKWDSFGNESFLHIVGPPVATLVVSGLIYGGLEPGFGLNEKGLVMLVGVVVTLGLVTYCYNGSQALVSRRLFSLNPAIHIFPLGILVAAVCVLTSRLEGYQPGIVYGFIASTVIFGDSPSNTEREAKTVLYPTLALLALCLLAWLLISPLRHLATSHDGIWPALPETIAVGVFVGSLEGTFFQMIPIRYLDGHKLWIWSKLMWLVVAGISAFMFWDLLLGDQSDSATTVTHGTPAAALVAMSTCCILSFGLYLFFRLRSLGHRSANAPN